MSVLSIVCVWEREREREEQSNVLWYSE